MPLIASSPAFLVLGATFLLVLKLWYGKWTTQLPPGPAGLPIIGNALQLPVERQWVKFAAWAKVYGEIVHVSAFGQPIIILSSPKAVFDLLDRRSSIYSDRPEFIFAGELLGYAASIPLVKYGDRHREYRKLISEVLNPRAVVKWRALQETQMREFLSDILRIPDQFLHHIRWYGSHKSHGITVRFIPEWTGVAFQQDAKKFRKTMVALRDDPYNMVKRQIAQGMAKPSFSASLIERDVNPSLEQELRYKWASVGLYSDVQKKAQEELDTVVGRDRLPSFQDRANLPYLNAIITEVYRWNPVGPLALPHRSTQDDVYNGFHIPAGSIVFANSWGILHDSSLYPSPDEFIPERFMRDPLSAEGTNPDPRRFAFGYGRRGCPGQDLADDSLFICAAMTLAVFDLRLEESTFEYSPSIISHPKPFRCTITPRSGGTETLVVGDGK
ncbi:cytochrome P450 [Mycena vulgaris]|nr:cytochrome P450 [Mycena vulgaris]